MNLFAGRFNRKYVAKEINMKQVTNCENIDSKAGNTIVDYTLGWALFWKFWNIKKLVRSPKGICLLILKKVSELF